MSCYSPKRKTASGVEEVTLPIASIEGLSEELAALEPTMPMIRVGSVTDIDGTMIIGGQNPIIFTVEIIDGQLQVGDQVQICTRQLFTYDEGRRRKMRLRKQWYTTITEQNVNERFIFVSAGQSSDANAKRLFRTDSASPSTKTLSALYVRVRRPVYNAGTEVDGLFSNIVTVWKRYNRGTGKIYIK
ncbi:MAG: hypothetical protein IJV87_05240 [Clostridia bacterium]|nr:hypothetical protein [Clostridia bacterium]